MKLDNQHLTPRTIKQLYMSLQNHIQYTQSKTEFDKIINQQNRLAELYKSLTGKKLK